MLCLFSMISFFLVLSVFFVLFVLYIDIHAKKTLDKQTSYVYGKNQVRNVDYLLIGDLFDETLICDKNSTIVSIQSYNRSLDGSFWILKRMFSLVDETRGKVIIVVKEKNVKSSDVTLFEYSFLSPVIRRLLNVFYLEKKRRHPFLYSPYKSFQLLYGKRSRNTYVASCPNSDIVAFCKERNLNFEYRIIK